MSILAIGSARISWQSIKTRGSTEPRKMLVISASRASTRSTKHAEVMLSEYQVKHIRKWLEAE